ncbi:MAG: WG repeat-containing protein [Bacteroidetes bacterium]|nr:MAG: WG repeat-containing protein [Bacteroidota bacterium]
MKKSIILVIALFTGFGSLNAQSMNFPGTISCANSEEMLLKMTVPYDSLYKYYDLEGEHSMEEVAFQFVSRDEKQKGPVFTIPACEFSLNIDGDHCYLNESEAFLAVQGKKMGMMNMRGEISVPFEYDNIVSFSYDSIAFLQKGKKWFAFRDGETSKIKLDDVLTTESGYFVVRKGNRLYFLDRELNFHERIPDKEEEKAEDRLFRIRHKCLVGVGSGDGKIIVEPAYSFVQIGRSIIIGSLGGKYQMITKTGEKVTDLSYDHLEEYDRNGFTRYRMGGKYGLIDLKGKELTEPLYQQIYLHEGYSMIKEKGKWGFVDAKAQVLIKPEYEDVSFFKNGLAGAKKDGKIGFIDEQGKVIIDFQFDPGPPAYFYDYERAKVKKDGQCYYIDRKGTITGKIPCRGR